MTPQLLFALKDKFSKNPTEDKATADKFYHPYPFGLEIILIILLGALAGVVFSNKPQIDTSNNTSNSTPGITSDNTPNNTSDNTSNNTSSNTPNDAKKWDLIWKQEGTGCQNWANDTQNKGGAWFTCLGITQRAWANYRRGNPSLPERVEVAYRQDKEAFKKHAIRIYQQQYCRPVKCDDYQGPLPALLMAISANGGPGTARKHLNSTANITNPKERAMAIAKLEHNRYDQIASRNPSQMAFRRGGWQQNIDNRYAYIKGFY